MAIGNVDSILSKLRLMPDPQLQQFAAMHKNDPFLLPLAIQEDTARKQMRMSAQAQAMGQEPPKVVDQAIASIGQMMAPQGPGAPQGGPMPPQGAGPQGAAPQVAGLPTLQAPNVAKMADGGIAGYPDDEEVGMAEGGVARYNGQDESRVRQDVQLARDQEAFGILLSELQKAQAQAAQGNPRAQGDVEAIQKELRIHIRRNPSFAQMLTGALPMGTAQAAPVQAAPVPAQAAGTPGEGRLAAPITAAAGATGLAGLGAAMAGKEAGAAQFRPGTTMGQALRRILGGTVAVPGAVAAGGAAATGTAANQMAAMAPEQREQFYSNPMLGAMGGDAALAAAIMNAGTGDIAPPAKPMPYGEQMANVGKFLLGAPRKERTPPPAPAVPAPAARPISELERTRLMEANQPPASIDPSTIPKEDKKAIIDAAKAATPKAERKGLTNDDYLVMGLTMMANPGRGRGLQGLLEAVGTGGIAAVQSKLAREKTEREVAKEESEAKYREALGEQARRGPTELALIERIAKENNVSFTKAMEMIAGAKREPQTEEALMKAWSSSAFLQLQYPNPQDYIKLMRASTGGAPSAAGSEGFRVIGSRPAP